MTFEEKTAALRAAVLAAEVHGFSSHQYAQAQAVYAAHWRKGPKPQKRYDHRPHKKSLPSFVFVRASA